MWAIDKGNEKVVELDMAFHLDADTIKRAHKCKHLYKCLNGGGKCLCPVEEQIGEEDSPGAFVQYIQGNSCSYRVSYGIGSYNLCTCPVRIEIYKRYGK